MRRAVTVPTLLLVILQKVELVAIGLIVDNVCLRLRRQGLHVLHVTSLVQFDRREPSAIHAFVAGVTYRSLAASMVAVVATIVHQVPYVHSEVRIALAGVIHIRQAHAMAELMTSRTDAVDVGTRLAGKFAAACIRIDTNAIQSDCPRAVAEIARRGELILVRPDGLESSPLCLAITSIDDVHLIHLAVVVPVVIGKVHRAVCQSACLGHHLGRVLVITVRVVLSVIAQLATHRDRPHDIEREIKLPIALTVEVVVNGASHVIVRISLLVEEIEIGGVAVGHFPVGKVHQNNQSLLVPAHGIRLGAPLSTTPRTTHLAVLLAGSGTRHSTLLQLGIFRQAEDVLVCRGHIFATICCCIIMDVLVAREHGFHRGAVSQHKRLLHSLCRHSHHTHCYERQQDGKQSSLLDHWGFIHHDYSTLLYIRAREEERHTVGLTVQTPYGTNHLPNERRRCLYEDSDERVRRPCTRRQTCRRWSISEPLARSQAAV